MSVFVGYNFTMTANGLGICEDEAFKAQMLNKPQKLVRIPDAQI
jgi:hypothetical protein